MRSENYKRKKQTYTPPPPLKQKKISFEVLNIINVFIIKDCTIIIWRGEGLGNQREGHGGKSKLERGGGVRCKFLILTGGGD